ncbi:hypothetical protein ZWY2020_040489 [Hordeum vulgare]|nr:hypothetical protein ZWY2020_040489 [Hordeum vulgare]
MSKFATPPPTRNSDMSPVLDDAAYAIHDAYDDALLDNALPLGAFLDAQIARVTAECDDTFETDELLKWNMLFHLLELALLDMNCLLLPEGYVMEGEVVEDFLACKDSYDLENLLRKWK